MGTIQSEAFRSERFPIDVVEGHIDGPAFDVQIHFTRWPEPGEAVFEPSMWFVEMFLTASRQVSGTYLRGARPGDYGLLGDIALIPKASPLYCSWVPGVQRSVSCMFDIGRLSERAAVEWSWPDFDPERALNIQNEYISAGLRRIAEEVLSPGFASIAQIECSLLFVALELRRHLEGDGRPASAGTGKLSRHQLALLRSMLVDTPDAPPSIRELAAACGMGGRQLAQAYRRTTGLTLRSFIANARLERAKMLLLDRHALIKQVAFDSGFRSSAAFAAAFRKETGVTPAEFRVAMAASRGA